MVDSDSFWKFCVSALSRGTKLWTANQQPCLVLQSWGDNCWTPSTAAHCPPVCPVHLGSSRHLIEWRTLGTLTSVMSLSDYRFTDPDWRYVIITARSYPPRKSLSRARGTRPGARFRVRTCIRWIRINWNDTGRSPSNHVTRWMVGVLTYSRPCPKTLTSSPHKIVDRFRCVEVWLNI